jgi:hypothetical protein
MTVVNDHPLRPLMKYNQNQVKRSIDKNKGYGSISGNDAVVAAGLGAIVQETTRIATLLGDFGIFLDYVSEYPKYDKDYISPFTVTPKISNTDVSSLGETHMIDRRRELDRTIEREGGGGRYYQTEFYEEMFTNKFSRALKDENKGRSVNPYGYFDKKTGNFLISEDNRQEFERAIANQADDYLKKKYRDDLELLLDGPMLMARSYNTSINERETERAGLYIEGIRIISEGIVTSVNDMVTEMTFQFIARDLKTISRLNNFKSPAIQADQLSKILSHKDTLPMQMMLEHEKLMEAYPGLKIDNLINSRDENDNFITTIYGEMGSDFRQSTKKERNKKYGTRKRK